MIEMGRVGGDVKGEVEREKEIRGEGKIAERIRDKGGNDRQYKELGRERLWKTGDSKK